MTVRHAKVTDVIRVLRALRDQFREMKEHVDISRLRKYSIDIVSASELRKGRFQDERSAKDTISDACGRRLRPDVIGIRQFDYLAELWLREGSLQLKEILLKQSDAPERHAEVHQFFDA